MCDFPVSADTAVLDEQTRQDTLPTQAADADKKAGDEKVGLALPIIGLHALKQRIGIHNGKKN